MTPLRTSTARTQRDLVLEFLCAGRRLSNLLAMTNLGVGSLSSRVAELRKAGHDIRSVTEKDHFGKRYKVYFLATKGKRK